MDIAVLSNTFEPLRVIDSYESFIWTDRYSSCGDFELYLAMDDSYLELFKLGYFLSIPQSDRLMIIEKITIDSDSQTGAKATITGRSIESLLDRRIVWAVQTVNTSLEEAVRLMINEAFINPTDEKRKVSNLILTENWDQAFGSIPFKKELDGVNVYETIQKSCEENDVGFKLILNVNRFEFSLYKGTDHSLGQYNVEPVIFSHEFDNLTNSSFYNDMAPYKNATLIGGEGRGEERKFYGVASEAVGWDRREVFTNASSVSSKVKDEDGNSYEVTEEEYNAMLADEGNKKLRECTVAKDFSGEADPTVQYTYGRDFKIGDLVEIKDAYGNETRVRIVEYIISDDANGYKAYPTFRAYAEDAAVSETTQSFSGNGSYVQVGTGIDISPAGVITKNPNASEDFVNFVEAEELTTPMSGMNFATLMGLFKKATNYILGFLNGTVSVVKANRFTTARTLTAKLDSTTSASFDGSENVNIGVSGILPVANGGTGANNAADARHNLGAMSASLKGSINGVAELGSDGKVPAAQLPSYVDDVLEYNNLAVFPAVGETGKIYIAIDTNKTYRWSGTQYVVVSETLALGETSSTAYRGDRGKTAYDHSQITSGNPHQVTKTEVGLGNVPNVATNDQTPTFSEASSRANIASGEKLSVIFSKIAKYFSDLKAVAFSGDKSDIGLGNVENKSSATIRGELTKSNVTTALGYTPVDTNDSRMSNARPASDVYAWAKAATKPTYTAAEVGAMPAGSSPTPGAHNQAASTITAGTFAGQVNANASAAATVGTAQMRDVYAGTGELTSGSSTLTSGVIYVQYE